MRTPHPPPKVVPLPPLGKANTVLTTEAVVSDKKEPVVNNAAAPDMGGMY